MRKRIRITTHLGKVPLPQPGSKKIRQLLDLAQTENFLQRLIDCGGIGFRAKNACSLRQELLIKHKICTFHVYSVA